MNRRCLRCPTVITEKTRLQDALPSVKRLNCILSYYNVPSYQLPTQRYDANMQHPSGCQYTDNPQLQTPATASHHTHPARTIILPITYYKYTTYVTLLSKCLRFLFIRSSLGNKNKNKFVKIPKRLCP